jgi:hypothetical protein
MVSIMAMLTVKGRREVRQDIFFVVPPLEFVFISTLAFLVTLVLVAASRLVLLGVIFP